MKDYQIKLLEGGLVSIAWAPFCETTYDKAGLLRTLENARAAAAAAARPHSERVAILEKAIAMLEEERQ